MTSSATVSVREETTGAAGGRAGTRPARHLRVLPPVPRAYAVAPAPPGTPAAPSPGSAGVRRTAGERRGEPALPPLRLTARGRRLLVVVALLLALAVVALVSAVLGDGRGGLELMGTTSVVVEPGDTLWSIASTVAGERDVREVVDGIQRLNDVPGSAIVPGQVLRLP
ncbi:LysM peptidoglycan-binding domain-containing protein [Blastococcus sp. SYSU DS0619]